MKALLSAVGTRGDVQPLFAVAVRLRALGHEVRLAIPPNFVAWAQERLGFDAVAVGVEMRAPPKGAPPPTAEQMKAMAAAMPDLISNQFDVVERAADGCDVILGGNAHQYAAPSIAALRGIPFVAALYAPVALPSPEHAPPPAMGQAWAPSGDAAENVRLWHDNLGAWNARALERVNANRQKHKLAPIDDVLHQNITAHPWLATDVELAPPPQRAGLPGRAPLEVTPTGAFILPDDTPLPPALARFLDDGDAPVYLGFGSMPAPPGVSRTLIDAARAAGRRAILSEGWAELALVDDDADCIAVGDVNQQALFPRCAAVVHHGGAGTTAAAARAGVPQLIAPMFSDQFYWASRVRALGLGAAVAGPLTPEALSAALRAALAPEIGAHARALAATLAAAPDGAAVAAERLVAIARG